MHALKEKPDKTRWELLIASLGRDLRYSVRMMRKNPSFAAVAVLMLALGIGASTTVYSWLDAVLVHPLPGVEKVNELVAFEGVASNGQPVTTSYADFRDFRDHATLIVGPAMARQTAFNVGEKESADRVWGQFVSGNYFDVLGVKPTVGRAFLPNEQGDQLGASPVAVISDRLWRSRFNSDRQIIGKTIRVDDHELTIVGVASPEFKGSVPGMALDIWVPLSMRPPMIGFKTDGQLRDRGFRDLLGIARLKPGVTVPQAQAEVASLARQLGETYPDSNRSISATVLPIRNAHFGPQGLLTAPLQILMAVCGILLLIVCANVANLLLARVENRRREFSVQLALGAQRAQLIRQMLIDSMVLAIAGTILGIVVAEFCGGLLRYLLPGGEGPNLQDLRPNLHVLGFAGLLCIVTALLSGLAPAIQFRQATLNEDLKSNAGKAIGGQSSRVRAVLAISEVSLALVALVGAGLFSRGFRAAQKIEPGFNASHIVFSEFYSTSSYNIAERLQFCVRLREKLESKPGITAVAYSDAVPLGFQPSGWEELEIKGYVPAPGENMRTYRNVVSPGYFQLMEIPLMEGRDFTELDDKSTAPVMIVNQAFVKHFLGQGMAIGRQVHGWGKWFTVVGVVKDSKYNYLTEGPTPYFYVPFRQIYRADMTLAMYVRSNIDPRQELATVRQAVREVDPKVVIFDTLPLASNLTASLFPQKVAAVLLNGLGLLALLLTAIGLYSVMSYSVAQRTHEIGLRMALGAQRSSVFGWVLRRGMALTLAGLLLGALAAVVLSRGASHLRLPGLTMAGAGNLLGTSTVDLTVYLGAAVFLCAIVTLANYIPAHRATKIDPLIAIRYE